MVLWSTVEAMSRPEQEEAEKVFEEARGEASSQGELMAGGQVPLVGGQVPYSQLFLVVCRRYLFCR